MRPCSFHHDAVPLADARALIELFARERLRWTRAVPERDCARHVVEDSKRRLPVWQEVVR
jgi:hypothetical protein